MGAIISLLKLISKLGIANIATVFLFRVTLRLGLFSWLMPIRRFSVQKIFYPFSSESSQKGVSYAPVIFESFLLRKGFLRLFGNFIIQVGAPPDWSINPLLGRHTSPGVSHWSRVKLFGKDIGDIKGVWEASRFDWALVFARAWLADGDPAHLVALETWISDWMRKNPLNASPNWMCGQEAGIRIMQLLLATRIPNPDTMPSAGLIPLVKAHCQRIAPTIRYAMAQDNNHGTSEAAALFIGGGWLAAYDSCSNGRAQAMRWSRLGRRWLENRVARLFAEDGSFSQYSVNYHRLALDTLCQVEVWRRNLEEPEFSACFKKRAAMAAEWLFAMVDPTNGHAPNLGGNDGARLFVLSDTEYGDYRPTIQLAYALFHGRRAYRPGPWDEPAKLLGVPLPDQEKLPVRFSRLFPNGGQAVIIPPGQSDLNAWAMFRFPSYRFRPSHADCLHLDLWVGGENLLRDGGSFSYHTEEPWQSYFPSVQAHNTVQFDSHDQMPRLGRFLYGAWPKAEGQVQIQKTDSIVEISASYMDYWGCFHKRGVSGSPRCWTVTDKISGFRHEAVLRWRLAPGEWNLDGRVLKGRMATLSVEIDVPLHGIELTTGFESLFYSVKTPLPVFMITVREAPATIVTKIFLSGD